MLDAGDAVRSPDWGITLHLCRSSIASLASLGFGAWSSEVSLEAQAWQALHRVKKGREGKPNTMADANCVQKDAIGPPTSMVRPIKSIDTPIAMGKRPNPVVKVAGKLAKLKQPGALQLEPTSNPHVLP